MHSVTDIDWKRAFTHLFRKGSGVSCTLVDAFPLIIGRLPKVTNKAFLIGLKWRI